MIFSSFFLDFKSFTVFSRTPIFSEHLSIAASVCKETVLSKLLRLLFKDVLFRNHDRKKDKIKKSSLFVVQFSWELANYSFKINKL